MRAPFRGGNFVLDQRVHRLRIGHPQKRLGEAHERDAFPGRKPIFGQKHLHQAWGTVLAQAAHQPRAPRGCGGARGGIRTGLSDQIGQNICFGCMRQSANAGAERGKRGHGRPHQKQGLPQATSELRRPSALTFACGGRLS